MKYSKIITALGKDSRRVALWWGSIFVIATVATLFITTRSGRNQKTPNTQTTFSERGNDISEQKKAENYWGERMKILGPKETYREFIASSPKNPLAAHEVTHSIGALLYEKLGWEGLGLCDHSNTYACYHGVIERAIEREGLGAIETAWKACPQKDAWERDAICIHGIGHGVLAYVGREYLDRALSLCDKIHAQYNVPEKNITGCFSGVFMEYHFWDSNGAPLPRVNPDDPGALKILHAPCSALPAPYRLRCYFEQPDWWKEALARDYARISSLCAGLPSEKEKDACFYGFAFTVSREPGEGRTRMHEICSSLPVPQERKRCIVGAAWVYTRIPHRSEWTRELCETLSGKDRERCLNPSFE